MTKQAATDSGPMERSGARRSIAQELRWLILLAVLPFVAVIALLAFLGYWNARSNAAEFVRGQAVRVSLDVQRFIGQTERGLRLVAGRAAVHGVDGAHCDPWLADLVAIQPRFLNVNLIDRDGWIVCGATPAAGGPRSVNISDREWFQTVAAGRPFALGAPRKGPLLGRWNSTVAVRISGPGGAFAGAVVAAIDLVGWEPPGSRGALPEGAILGVIDAAGTIVMRFPDAEKWVGLRNLDIPIFAELLRVRDGVFAAPGALGFERIWAVTPIPGTDWLAYASIRSSTVLVPALKEIAFAVALAAIALLVAVWLALKASRALAQPIAGIVRAVRTHAAGGNDPIQVEGPSEIMELEQEFNRMLDARYQAQEALRESERNLQLFINHAPAALAMFDRDMRYLNVSRRWLSDYGLGDRDLRGLSHYEVFPDIPEHWREVHRRALAGEVVRLDMDRFERANGLVQWIQLEVRPWHDSRGGIGGIVVFSEDLTKRKRLEEVHLQAQKLESLGTLAGGIAHDFNNILAAIRGNADLAVEDVGSDHIAAQSLEEIKKATIRGRELVRRILAFARPGEVERQIVDLSEVLGEVLKLLRSTLPAGISLGQAFAEDPPRVLADSGQIHEAVVNLTTNAVYAIGAQTGSIEYRLEPVEVDGTLARSIPGLKEGRYARLTVEDSGCGMDAAVMERIFDAFYTTKPVGEGTGLGLSMVHGIMRSHGGAVTVTSKPGKGSIFSLYFPAVGKDAVREEKSARAPQLPIARQRVLYVDDEEALAYLANRVLTRMGHQISSFIDPEEALEAFRAHPHNFDIVVTDLSMPHMSGLEFASEVLSVRPEIPVLMMTGDVRGNDQSNARAIGIREVIIKPATIDDLGRVLDRIFRDSERTGGPPV